MSRAAAPSVGRLFDCPFVLLGRHPRSDLILEDGRVSRRHAFFQAIAGRILVTDLQSRSKVYWEGEETPRSQGWFGLEGFIQVGPYRIRRSKCDFSENQHRMLPGPSAPDAERFEVGPVPRAALELPIRMNDGPSLWPVKGQLAMVGRSDLCQLVLTDDSISRFHAVLVPTPAGLWVVDLVAREGVYVNGERVRWAWLADGDSLRMGRFTFMLRYESPPDHTTRQDIPLEAGAILAEHPGTELVVSTGRSNNGRSDVVVGPVEGRARVALKVVPSPRTFIPTECVSSDGEAWEPAVQSPSIPMAIWQQQMQLMELFHNDMILMVQMFVAMHREHPASVHDELGKVEHLTQKLNALQARLTQTSDAADVRGTADIDRPSQKHESVQDKNREKPVKRSVFREPRRAGTRTESKPPEVASDPDVNRPKLRSAKSSKPTAADGSSAPDSAEIHALLTRRITELQRERQGYWKKILSAINK